MFNILKDIKSGALPFDEIPSFLAWYFRGLAWVAIVVAVLGTAVAAILIY